ncbi:MAG TPA: amidohydrolase family protein [Candidatus Acidoferrales bacterium]|nr:amidohydrolase family protein [Candidatus Acidoferrales bacterium]
MPSSSSRIIRPLIFSTSLFVFAFLLPPRVFAQRPDPALLAYIRSIRAIDDHAHPPALPVNGQADDEYDALPCAPLEPTASPANTRPDNPQFLDAWKALWNYKYSDMSAAHVQELLATKARIKKEQGENYPDWVLDRLGIETELANREAMGPGLRPPRFRWVPFDDALLFPLDNSALASETPDRQFFFTREEQLLRRYLENLSETKLPATLDAYLKEVVLPTLQNQKQNGAVAVKFEAAYLRSLDFGRANAPEAAQEYATYINGGVPQKAGYTNLQNYIFHYIALEAGRLEMPVHFHTGFGCGGYFELAGANPLLLEPVLNDPSLRGTNFVLLHGGAGPFSKAVAALLMKPNVYTDFSEQTWLLPTRELSRTIRYWLEYFPEKVMFGTDLYPGTPQIDWEEVGWQTANSGREALAIALTGMMNDNEITRARAREIARMVLRGNALKLYGWPDQQTPTHQTPTTKN